MGEELSEALAKVQPIQERYTATANRVRRLAGLMAHGEHTQPMNLFFKIAQSPEPPLPDQAALDRWAGLNDDAA